MAVTTILSLLILCISGTEIGNSEIIPCKNDSAQVVNRSISARWTKETYSEDWKYLTFTTQWPQTFCMQRKAWHEPCSLPANVSVWTIHGLWPSTSPGVGPHNCNTSWAFDSANIEDLMLRMNQSWPSMNPGFTYFSFWGYEWCKHGTCGQTDPILRGQHTYFQMGLDLCDKYNPYNILKKANIVPSDSKSYKLDDLYSAFKDATGVAPSFSCFMSNANEKSYISEVELCLSKSLEPIQCEERARVEYHKCGKDVYYPIIQPTHSQKYRD